MNSLCIYCGSSPGRRPEYAAAARELAQAMAERGLTLVYGGASVGIMGVLANAMLAAGGRVIGVIPRALMDREVGHLGLTELHVVGSMHERKLRMAELSDGFVALPGGIGTLEELFEIWTWAQLGLHRKSVGLVNTAGYFDHLVAFLDHSVAEGYVKPDCRSQLAVAANAQALLRRFAAS